MVSSITGWFVTTAKTVPVDAAKVRSTVTNDAKQALTEGRTWVAYGLECADYVVNHEVTALGLTVIVFVVAAYAGAYFDQGLNIGVKNAEGQSSTWNALSGDAAKSLIFGTAGVVGGSVLEEKFGIYETVKSYFSSIKPAQPSTAQKV